MRRWWSCCGAATRRGRLRRRGSCRIDLAYNNDANKAKIVKAGAVAPLVELLRCGDVAGKTAAAWTLNNLASISANQLGEDREGWSGGASGGAAAKWRRGGEEGGGGGA
jgi:hypothetical protein